MKHSFCSNLLFLLRAFETGDWWKAEIKWDDQLSLLQNSRKWPSRSPTHQGCTAHSSAVPSPIFQLHLGTSLLQGFQSGATLSFQVFGPVSGTDGEKDTPGALREALGAGRAVGAQRALGSPARPRLEKMAPASDQGQGVAPATAPRRVGPRAGQGWLLGDSRAGARGRRCTRPAHAARPRGPCRSLSLCLPWRWRMTSMFWIQRD